MFALAVRLRAPAASKLLSLLGASRHYLVDHCTSMADSNSSEHASKRQKITYEHTKESFMETYNTLRDQLLADGVLNNPPAHAVEWFKEVMDYNVPGGKLNRGMAVYDVLAAIRGGEALSESDVFKANTLGWCIEWLQAFFLVADDIMDGSITRRGQPCWYRQNKVGMIACNDYILLECCIYSILHRHFEGHSALAQLLKLFHEVTFQTAHGQMLDLITAPAGMADLSKYTLDTYMRIVTYKTAYYSFYLPVACGMLLAGITDTAAYETARGILIEMGQYFQIQDDYLDCYGDPEVIGKIGTDIEDNKCSWLICTALQHASPEQKQLIQDNYGRKDAGSVSAIKELYNELGLERKFKEYEASSYEKLCASIDQQAALPKQVFNSLLTKIYKRLK